MLCGLLAGLAGFLSLTDFASTTVAGHADDALGAITAVVIGGTVLEGGRVRILGTVWGAVLSIVLTGGLAILGAQSFYQLILVGDRAHLRRRPRPVQRQTPRIAINRPLPARLQPSGQGASPKGTIMSAVRNFTRRRHVQAALPAALAATALLAAACTTSGSPGASTSPTSGSGKTLVVRGVAGNTSDPFWDTFMCGATKEAAKLGINFKWYAGTTTDTTAMQTNYNAALLDHPQGMLLNPFDAGQFAAAAKRLMAKGIPVVSSVPFAPPTQYEAVLTNQVGTGLVPYALKLAGSSGAVATVGGAAGIPVIAQRYSPPPQGA